MRGWQQASISPTIIAMRRADPGPTGLDRPRLPAFVGGRRSLYPGHSFLQRSDAVCPDSCSSGLQLGFVYALIALGYTMVYGIVRLINFAHGDVFMVGAFVSYYAVARFSLHMWPQAGLPGHAARAGDADRLRHRDAAFDGGLYGRWRSSSSAWPTSRCAMRRASRP